MFEKEAEEYVKEQFPNDEFLQSEISRKLVEFADLADGKVDEVKEQLTRAKELLEDLIRFQPYIDKETIFLSIGNEWKTAIYKAEQFLKEVEE